MVRLVSIKSNQITCVVWYWELTNMCLCVVLLQWWDLSVVCHRNSSHHQSGSIPVSSCTALIAEHSDNVFRSTGLPTESSTKRPGKVTSNYWNVDLCCFLGKIALKNRRIPLSFHWHLAVYNKIWDSNQLSLPPFYVPTSYIKEFLLFPAVTLRVHSIF